MSAQAMAWVLDHSESTGAARLVLLSIANHIDPDGEGWAHVERICEEAKVSEDSYHRAVKWAMTRGELEREVQSGGSKKCPDRYRPNLYRLPGVRTDRTPTGGQPADPPGGQGADPAGMQGADPHKGAFQEPSPEPEPTAAPSTDAEKISAVLAAKVEDRTGRAPKISAEWLKDMDLLIRRGPTTWATPKPIPADVVARAVEWVFGPGSERDRTGFSWADQVHSGSALRRHWDKLVIAAKAQRERGEAATSASPPPWAPDAVPDGHGGWVR